MATKKTYRYVRSLSFITKRCMLAQQCSTNICACSYPSFDIKIQQYFYEFLQTFDYIINLIVMYFNRQINKPHLTDKHVII